MNQSSAKRTRSTRRVPRRSAFSLIELLVVIVIIAILMALILPAINSVRITARLTEVKTEITRFDSAIASFKAKYGVEPPSTVVLPNLANGVGWDPISRRRIRQVWPQFDFTTVGGIDVGHFGGRDFIILTGAECLTFFLGGMPATGGSGGPWSSASNEPPLLIGFSKNPRAPFALGGTNRDTFYEFQGPRIVDVDGDSFPEYLDSLPGQETPYLYVKAKGSSGYRSQVPGGIDDLDVFSAYPANPDPDGNDIAELYDSAAGSLVDSGQARLNLASAYQNGSAGAWKKDSYQIISPGPDAEYGSASSISGFGSYAGGGQYEAGAGVQDRFEQDNVTNFNEGTSLEN